MSCKANKPTFVMVREFENDAQPNPTCSRSGCRPEGTRPILPTLVMVLERFGTDPPGVLMSALGG